ncbi:hypothetical protein JQM84_13525 [Parabacteroides distasonis]|nr:hypothetical protein [Parabacteroides distasonis]
MNKKLFTLAAGLLLGTAFTVNAQKTELAPNTKASDLDGWFYIAEYGNGADVALKDRYFLKGKEVGEANKKVTIFEKAEKAGVEAVDVKGKEEFLWKLTVVKKNGEVIGYQFTNKKTGGIATFNADGTNMASGEESDEYTTLTWEAFDEGKYITGGATLAASKTIKNSNGVLSVDNDGGKWAIYTQEKTVLYAGQLNKFTGNGFSLGFPKADPQPEENLLGEKLVAVSFKRGDVNDWNIKEAVTPAEGEVTYFVVSMPEGALNPDGKFVSEAVFNSSTFVAIEPEVNYGLSGNSRANGHGFGLKKVTGRELVAANDAKAKGQIAYQNAQFTVTEMDEANKPGEYTVEATPIVMTDATADKEKWDAKKVTITAVTSAGTTYVMTSGGNETVCMKSTTNIVKASGLLKKDAPAVFNVQFLSGAKEVGSADGSEYGKYLGLRDNTGTKMFAQGPAYLNLDAPQNQWVITAFNKDNGQFTFANREIAETTFDAQLRKTETEGVYEVMAGTAVGINWGKTDGGTYKASTGTVSLNSGKAVIKLIPVTVKPSAGYADYTDQQLMDVATLKFAISSGVIAKDLYVQAPAVNDNENKFRISQNDIDAAKWELIKNTAVKDSLYGYSNYAYIVKDETTATKKFEDKAITTYALKLQGKDLYLDWTDKYTTSKDKVNFVIKENPDGSAYLVKANANATYAATFKADTKAMSLTEAGVLTQASIYAINNPTMTIELGKVTPSLASVARHASFQSVNGGFIGVGTNGEAIIAATKDEAKELTFWLDTTDVKEATPSFYISQGIKVATKANADEVRNYLWNPADSAEYYDEGTASYVHNKTYYMGNTVGNDLKAMFRQATWVNADSLNTVVAGKEVGLNASNGLNAYKFQIVLADEATEGEYVIRSVKDGAYLKNINGKVALGNAQNALVVTLGEGDATANEAIAAEAGVQVIGGQGAVTVQGAAGKVVTVANILGQTIANQVAASDNVTIAAPAGIVVVAVEGEATKVVVK